MCIDMTICQPPLNKMSRSAPVNSSGILIKRRISQKTRSTRHWTSSRLPLEGVIPSTGPEGPLEGGELSTETGGHLTALYPVQELEVHLRMSYPGTGMEVHLRMSYPVQELEWRST